jgi:hypothetical protein
MDVTLLRNLTILYSPHGLIDLIIEDSPEQSKVEQSRVLSKVLNDTKNRSI